MDAEFCEEKEAGDFGVEQDAAQELKVGDGANLSLNEGKGGFGLNDPFKMGWGHWFRKGGEGKEFCTKGFFGGGKIFFVRNSCKNAISKIASLSIAHMAIAVKIIPNSLKFFLTSWSRYAPAINKF